LHIGHQDLSRADSFMDLLSQWDPSLYVVILLGAIFIAYLVGRWRLGNRSKYAVSALGPGLLFWVGFGALVLALLSPLDAYSGDLFFMHMVQHLLLMMVAAPLLLLANPVATYLWVLPQGPRHWIGRTLNSSGILRRLLLGATVPVAAWLLFGVVMWVWHAPPVYDAALDRESLHALEHLTMFGAAVIFWWPVIGPAPVRSHLAHPLRLLYLFLALFHNILLGAMLTFGEPPVYSHYLAAVDHWGVTPAQDQQLGGILMWLGGSMMYLVAMLTIFMGWLEQDERRAARWKRDQETRHRFKARVSTGGGPEAAEAERRE
jgi:putative membrane protein